MRLRPWSAATGTGGNGDTIVYDTYSDTYTRSGGGGTTSSSSKTTSYSDDTGDGTINGTETDSETDTTTYSTRSRTPPTAASFPAARRTR